MFSVFPLGEGNSLVSPPLNTTEAQERLDDEIAALTSMLCNLRTQRNTLSPISRLPPEILASIFIHCASHSRQRNRFGVPDWVNVSYVCRQWRDVALNCSALWSFLFASSKHWTNELLARSRTVPLKVRTDFEYSMESTKLDLLEKVAPQADRIQDLCLRLTRLEVEHVLPLLSSPAPLLQTLRISVQRPNYLGRTPPSMVSGALFDGHTPALRELELINYAFPLTSPTLRGLTFLRLGDFRTSGTLASLMVALSQMQDLAHLHLENALPSARANPIDQSFQNSEKFTFPKLSRLSIVAPFSAVVLVLSCFHIPLKAEVRLRCCFEPDVEDHTPIYPLLAKRFIASRDQAIALAPIIRTSFVETNLTTVSFIFSTADGESGRRSFSASTTSYDLDWLYEDWDCNIPLKVDIVRRSSLENDREDLVGGVYRSMPLTNLQSAHFSFDSMTALSLDFWKKTFGHLQELRHIKLFGVNMHGLVRALSPTSPHLSEDKSESLESESVRTFAPALTRLELYDVLFSKKCCACLYDAFSKRQTEGYGLSRLVLARCINVHACDLKGLGESVTDVVWDDDARPYSDSEDEKGGDYY